MDTSAKPIEVTQRQSGLMERATSGKRPGAARIIREAAPPDIVIQTGSAGHVAPPGQEYVDPYLFETGHFASREEYEELSRTATIKPRARA